MVYRVSSIVHSLCIIFQTSNVTTYKRMWAYMKSNFDRVMVADNQAGFKRVKESDYAFLAESTSIDYQVQRNCELMQIGDLLDNKGYGLAAPKGKDWVHIYQLFLRTVLVFFSSFS